MLLLNHQKVPVIKFPSGESHIRLDPVSLPTEPAAVYVRFDSNDDIISLILLDDILVKNDINYCLNIPYFPSSRQDRCETVTESSSLAVYAGFINDLIACTEVVILDPHSDVTTKYIIKPLTIQTLATSGILEAFIHVLDSPSNIIVVSPDKGAIARTTEVVEALSRLVSCPVHMLVADKERDYITGNIMGISLIEPSAITATESTRFLVVDDICDGGRTFIELFKELDNHYGPGITADLMVSHGFFSKGPDALYDAGYNELYAINDMYNKD